MNVIIKLNVKTTPEKAKKPSLEERICHAIECIDCDVNKKKAIDFLQKVRVHMEETPRQIKEHQVLLEKVHNALRPYGYSKMLGEDK